MLNNYKRIEKVVLTLLFLYFALKPIYIFKSGMPQIADFCLVFVFLLLITHKKTYTVNKEQITKINKIIKCFYPFLIWIVIISFFWTLILSKFSLMKPILFYLFNLMSIYIIKELYFIYNKEIIYKITKYVSLSCIIQFILSLIFYAGSGRATVLFNNPNQLGFYALLCCTYIISLEDYSNKKMFFVSLLSSVYLVLISLSKAAIIGSFGLLFVYFVFKLKNKVLKFLMVIILFFIFLLGYDRVIYNSLNNVPLFHSVIYKIENMNNENDSSLSTGRGYDRLKEIGIEIIYGVGEGDFYRFSTLSGYEIHSGYASIICYYGLIGFILLLYFVFKLLSNNPKFYLLLFGVFLYGFTHQIWRNTFLWILLFIMCVYNKKNGDYDERY